MNDKPTTPIDALFDENNNDVIVLFNENGEETAFEQIALIPKNERVYAILKPVRPMVGMGEDEALVFSIETDANGNEFLSLTIDEAIINDIFDIYDELLKKCDTK